MFPSSSIYPFFVLLCLVWDILPLITWPLPPLTLTHWPLPWNLPPLPVFLSPLPMLFSLHLLLLLLGLSFDSLILCSLPFFSIYSFSIFEVSLSIQIFVLFDIMLKCQIGAVDGCKSLVVNLTSIRLFYLYYCCYL